MQALVATDVAPPAAAPTHSPLHRMNPLPHTKAHAPSTHAASALPALAVHALPQDAQFLGSLVKSTQAFAHEVGAVDGQLAVHA
jgi:hypothetical protein